MKRYYYDNDTKHLYTEEEQLHPFICPAEAEPLMFDNPKECLEHLSEQDIEGIVVSKVLT